LTAFSATDEIFTLLLINVQNDTQNADLDENTTAVVSFVESLVQNSLFEMTPAELGVKVSEITRKLANAMEVLSIASVPAKERDEALKLLGFKKRVEELNYAGESTVILTIIGVQEQVAKHAETTQVRLLVIRQLIAETDQSLFIPTELGDLEIDSVEEVDINKELLGKAPDDEDEDADDEPNRVGPAEPNRVGPAGTIDFQ